MEAARKTCAAVAGREVIAPSEILIGKRSRPVYGTLSAEAALARLLVGTGLRAETVDGAFVIRRETGGDMRSDKRRVGKAGGSTCRYPWSPAHQNNKKTAHLHSALAMIQKH